jgi:hypothetical protein
MEEATEAVAKKPLIWCPCAVEIFCFEPRLMFEEREGLT